MDVVQEPDTKKCSNCKVYISEANFDLHEVHCKTRLKLCDLCHCSFPKTELNQHYLDEHAPEPCDLCGEKLPRDKLDAHKNTSCPGVRMECKFCELEILRSEYEEHQNGCGSRTDFCELCNQRVMLKDMDEHKQAKCGDIKSEYTSNSLQRKRFEEGVGDVNDANWSSEELLLARSGDHLNRPPNFSPFRANQPSSPPLSPPFRYDTHADNSVHVDPQWLASVTGVCGQDNMDQVLAQNLQAVKKYGNGSGASVYSSDRANERDVESFRSDDGRSKCILRRRLNMYEGRNHGLAGAPSGRYDPDTNLNYHRRDDFTPPQPQRDMSQEELERIETEKKDAELAWMIHERDNAYSWHGGESSKTTDGGSNMGEEDYAEMARMMHERNVLYAQRNQRKDGSTDRVNAGSECYANEMSSSRDHNPRLPYTLDGPRRVSADESKSELGRILRREKEKHQINRNLERGDSVGIMSTEDDDTEMLRIHERDLSYAMKNASHEGGEGSGWISTDHTELYNGDTSHYDEREGFMLESSDAILARALARRESDYVEKVEMDRMLAKQMQEAEAGPFGNVQNDFEAAQRIQMEQGLESLMTSHTHMGYNRDVLKDEQPRAKTPAEEVEFLQDEGEVPCQYCYSLFPFKMIMEHQEICRSEPSHHSKHKSEDLYPSIHPSGFHRDVVLTEELVQSISNPPVNSTFRLDDRETGKCEYCNVMIAVDTLGVHQVTCKSNPDRYLRNAYSPRIPQNPESLLTISTQHHPTSAVSAANLNAKGPCEVCGELVPIDILVRHEGTCQARGITITSNPPSVSTDMAVQHEEVDGANSTTHGTGDTLAAAESTTVASNPKTKHGVGLAIRFPEQGVLSSHTTSKPSSDVLCSSLNPLSTTPSLHTNHHHLLQSRGASVTLATNKKMYLSSLLQSKQPRTNKPMPNSTRKSHEVEEIAHGRRHCTRNTSQATETLGIIGRSVGTKSARTTAATFSSDRTKKSSEPSQEADVYESSGSTQTLTLPKVASTRKTLRQQSSGSTQTLTLPEVTSTRKTLRQQSSGSTQPLPEVASTRKHYSN